MVHVESRGTSRLLPFSISEGGSQFRAGEATINLPDGKCRHTQRMPLLGENGVGVTKLLKCFRGMSPLPERIPASTVHRVDVGG